MSKKTLYYAVLTTLNGSASEHAWMERQPSTTKEIAERRAQTVFQQLGKPKHLTPGVWSKEVEV